MIWESICNINSAYLTIMIGDLVLMEVNLDKEYLMYFDSDSNIIYATKNLGSFLDLSIPVPTNEEDILQEEIDGNPNNYSYTVNGVTYIWMI